MGRRGIGGRKAEQSAFSSFMADLLSTKGGHCVFREIAI